MNNRRVSMNDIGVSKDVLPFAPISTGKAYYQVVVGSYGVVIPAAINLDTMDGLQLIKGKASVIENRTLAVQIAAETLGKVLKVTDTFERYIEEVLVQP